MIVIVVVVGSEWESRRVMSKMERDRDGDRQRDIERDRERE